MQINDKLREALGKILWCLEWMFNNTDDKSVQGHLIEPIALAKAALAEPVKNCEVGTAKKQAERFAEYCDSEVCKRKRCKSQAKALCIERCALAWAQMPYEEGGAK